jgi:hypothetical protein
MPWGDGIVDVEDVKVLAGYIGMDVVDPSPIAHWAFDEMEGDIACDSSGENDGAVTGSCLWQPVGGQLNGALAFDGTTSVAVGRVLDPADGSFSVLAWVNGGTPGQVMISQVDGVNWLMIDTVQGTLSTELVPTTQRAPVPPLVSDAVITDGSWHRVAVVWDGATRSLYVDDALVAQDEQSNLAGCRGGLNIGCDKDMTPGSFFTGLIDDVRIYDRVVTP